MSKLPAQPLNWGILGPGRIASKFAAGLKTLPESRLLAVASRRAESAQEFAAAFDLPLAYGAYEDMLENPAVEAVYIATPHVFHREHTLLCLEAGKHVLCEKPLARNAAEAREMAAKARETGLFLMEAMWTRFLPLWEWLEPEIRGGILGTVSSLQADFGFNAPFDPADRKFNPGLAGGALLDVGIYPVSLACWLFGTEKVSVKAMARMGPTGVDLTTHALLQFEAGEMALTSCSVEAEGARTAWVLGEEGHVAVPLFWRASELVLHRPQMPPLYQRFPFENSGLQYQAQAMGRALRAGLTEHPRMPLAASVAIMEVMDEIRRQTGLVYPGEKA